MKNEKLHVHLEICGLVPKFTIPLTMELCSTIWHFFLGASTIKSINVGVTILMVVQESTFTKTKNVEHVPSTSPHLLDVHEQFQLNSLVFGVSFIGVTTKFNCMQLKQNKNHSLMTK